MATSLRRLVRRAGKRVVRPATHAMGRLTGANYFEDYVRVYPGGVVYNRLGVKRQASPAEVRNFRNHVKVYFFASQFVAGKRVADVGCGSGYGCKILRDAGAAAVYGADVSSHAIRFARKHFGREADFSQQTITDLSAYANDFVDVVVCSEVLEHIKEYGLEDRALSELVRIVRPGGILVVGTPNSELLGEHGFSYDEITDLFDLHFGEYCLFENALVPFEPEAREAWERRREHGRVGIVVSSQIDLGETVLPQGANAVLKKGRAPGKLDVAGLTVDTTLLHNTHGWLVLAVKPADQP